MADDIELILFTTEPGLAEAADRAGVDGLIVDWEDRHRFKREHGPGEAGPDTPEDLDRIRRLTKRPLWCRINQPGAWTPAEVETAIERGADVVLLPMVRSRDEVVPFLRHIGGRAKAGILVETVEACEDAARLAELPLDYVYLGLFDLSISRNHGDIFAPLTDGTAAQLRENFAASRFGVAGLTALDKGDPLTCREMMTLLAGLGCDFTFLRNAFKRDVAPADMGHEVARIREQWRALLPRPDR